MLKIHNKIIDIKNKFFYSLNKHGVKITFYNILNYFNLDDLSKNYIYLVFPFYNKYKLRKKESISFISLNDEGLIDFEFGYFYNRIQKSANTFICNNLGIMKFGENIDSPKKTLRKNVLTPIKLNKNDIDKFNTLYKFTFVRNPYIRILSCYLDKIVKNRENYREKHMKINYTPSFKEFCIYLENGGLFVNRHWAPQFSLLLIPVDHFDYIGKVENLPNDLLKVFENIKSDNINKNKVENIINYVEEKQKSSSHRTNSKYKIGEFYDEETKNIIYKLYNTDFKKFGYEKSLPKYNL